MDEAVSREDIHRELEVGEVPGELSGDVDGESEAIVVASPGDAVKVSDVKMTEMPGHVTEDADVTVTVLSGDVAGEKPQAPSYMYIVRCRDNSLYTGWTNHLQERIAAHNAGRGAKYTKSRRPVELVYYEAFGTKEEAMSREFHVKRLTRAEKLRLVGDGSVLPRE